MDQHCRSRGSAKRGARTPIGQSEPSARWHRLASGETLARPQGRGRPAWADRGGLPPRLSSPLCECGADRRSWSESASPEAMDERKGHGTPQVCHHTDPAHQSAWQRDLAACLPRRLQQHERPGDEPGRWGHWSVGAWAGAIRSPVERLQSDLRSLGRSPAAGRCSGRWFPSNRAHALPGGYQRYAGSCGG